MLDQTYLVTDIPMEEMLNSVHSLFVILFSLFRSKKQWTTDTTCGERFFVFIGTYNCFVPLSSFTANDCQLAPRHQKWKRDRITKSVIIYIYIYTLPSRGLSTLVKELTAATCVMQGFSNSGIRQHKIINESQCIMPYKSWADVGLPGGWAVRY